LRFSPQSYYSFSNYFFASKEVEVALVDFSQLMGSDFIYLWGEQGSGKSHLLLAIAEKLHAQSENIIYLSLNDLLLSATPEAFNSIELQKMVLIDDLEAIVGNKDWEEALFHCFNRLRLAGNKLLISARQNPSSLAFSLPDLKSRLATGVIYQLPSLDDQQKMQALIMQAKIRGIHLPEDVAQYLLRHFSREMVELMQLLTRLDKASLSAQRRLTIPFVSQVIADG
jgi:DnaA family protein